MVKDWLKNVAGAKLRSVVANNCHTFAAGNQSQVAYKTLEDLDFTLQEGRYTAEIELLQLVVSIVISISSIRSGYG